jgi:hypothetical protein
VARCRHWIDGGPNQQRLMAAITCCAAFHTRAVYMHGYVRKVCSHFQVPRTTLRRYAATGTMYNWSCISASTLRRLVESFFGKYFDRADSPPRVRKRAAPSSLTTSLPVN